MPDAYEDFSLLCRTNKESVEGMEDAMPLDEEESRSVQSMLSGIVFLEEFMKELLSTIHVKVLELDNLIAVY